MESRTRDALGRRLRETPASTGRYVVPTERDIRFFEAIARHGPLSTTYLHEFVKATHPNYKATQTRLTVLFNEANTPHSGPYLSRPWQQFKTIDARYQDLIYDLTPASKATLNHPTVSHHGHWVHQFMSSCVTASIDLHSPGYIPQPLDDISYPVPYVDPRAGAVTKTLIPDALFGIDYGSKVRYFVVEVDRGTETVDTTLDKKSARRFLFQYREFIGKGLYKRAYDLSAGLMLLVVTTSQARAENMMKLLLEITGGKGNNYILFTHIPQFGTYFKPPPVLDLYTRPWLRAGHEAFHID